MNRVKRFPPDTSLLRRLGGWLPRFLPESQSLAANRAIQDMAGELTDEMTARIAHIADVAEQARLDPSTDIRAIYRDAHELRGICGSFGWAIVGNIANTLCNYIDEAEVRHEGPRKNTLWLYAATLKRFANREHPQTAASEQAMHSLCGLYHKDLRIPCPKGCNCEFRPEDQEGWTAEPKS